MALENQTSRGRKLLRLFFDVTGFRCDGTGDCAPRARTGGTFPDSGGAPVGPNCISFAFLWGRKARSFRCSDDLTGPKKTDKIRTAKGEDEDKYRLTHPDIESRRRVKGGQERGRREITSSSAAEPGGNRSLLSCGGCDRYIICEWPGPDRGAPTKRVVPQSDVRFVSFKKRQSVFLFPQLGKMQLREKHAETKHDIKGEDTMDYNKTVHLPETDFPMRAALPKREPDMLKKFYDHDLYHKMVDRNDGKPLFVLHDGPPYANGNIHIGTALNKILKDFIVKSHNMMGFQAP